MNGEEDRLVEVLLLALLESEVFFIKGIIVS